MKRNILLYAVCVLSLLSTELKAQQVNVTINSSQGKDTISRHIYGHFAEHLGRCIYNGIYVGEENKVIPNKEGVRLDIIEALKDLQIPNLRWPGGCFADTYHWKDGIGPMSERPTIVNRWWGGTTEDNSFGTHNFLNLCETLETEPYLSANVGSGTVQELIDWVQYTNHDGVSPMADLRRANGRQEPWSVKYWGVGNEAWGCGGNMTAEYYANVYKQFATFMPGWSGGKEIVRIASGASSEDYHWTEVLMRDVPSKLMEAVALHHYSVIDWSNKGPDDTFTEEQYFQTMSRAMHMEELVTRHTTIMDRYDPEKKVALYVDEWGGWYDGDTEKGVLYQQSTMRDAMIAGATLNIFNNHADRVKMANLAQVVNVLQAVILTDEEKMILTPTYHVMKMYAAHQDALLLPTYIEKMPLFERGDESLPALSISASEDDEGWMHISIVNIDNKKPQSLLINLGGKKVNQITLDILTADDVLAHNSFDEPQKINPTRKQIKVANAEQVTIEVPPHSLIMIGAK